MYLSSHWSISFPGERIENNTELSHLITKKTRGSTSFVQEDIKPSCVAQHDKSLRHVAHSFDRQRAQKGAECGWISLLVQLNVKSQGSCQNLWFLLGHPDVNLRTLVNLRLLFSCQNKESQVAFLLLSLWLSLLHTKRYYEPMNSVVSLQLDLSQTSTKWKQNAAFVRFPMQLSAVFLLYKLEFLLTLLFRCRQQHILALWVTWIGSAPGKWIGFHFKEKTESNGLIRRISRTL